MKSPLPLLCLTAALALCPTAWGQSPAATKSATLEDLYQRLNMRGFESPFGPRLKYFCQSYLRDYFLRDQVTMMPDGRMKLESGDDVWWIKFLGKNHVQISMSILRADHFRTVSFPVSFDPKTNTWHTRSIKVPQRVGCVQYVHNAHNAEDSNSRKTATPVIALRRVAKVRELESHSIGEISLGKSTPNEPASRIAVFGKNQKHIGWLKVGNQPGASAAKSGPHLITDLGGQVISQAPVLHRFAYQRRLLVFERTADGQFNVSADSARPLWIKTSKMPPQFRNRYLTRAKVIMQADWLSVRSAHRVRTGPGTQYPEVETLQKNQAALQAIEIAGDWMRVRYGKRESEIPWREGWLKWRGGRGNEWLTARYDDF